MAAPEVALVAAARAGDEAAFEQLVEPYRSRLRGHCYRMLGSFHDVDDAVQETLIRAWRGLDRFEVRSSPGTWMHTIATNVCLRMLERRPTRLVPLDTVPEAAVGEEPGRPLVESVWLEPYPTELLDVRPGLESPEARYSRRESVELAFVAALQHLPPLQRAALILRDVLGFSAQETAGALDTTVAAANSALQRARRTLDDRRPAVSQETMLAALGDGATRRLVERYAQAMEDGDVDTVVGMLVADAAWSMPPMSTWYRGEEAIRRFLVEWPLRHRWRHLPVAVNGQAATLSYIWDDGLAAFRPEALDVLTLEDDRIAEITAFRQESVLDRLGLPLALI